MNFLEDAARHPGRELYLLKSDALLGTNVRGHRDERGAKSSGLRHVCRYLRGEEEDGGG